jgi:predicted nucleic acid-binding protein
MIIAATAKANGCIVVTDNEPELGLEIGVRPLPSEAESAGG